MTQIQPPARRARHKRGTALLEVIVSLVLLGLSGTALITLLGQSAQSLSHVRRAELGIRGASDELARFVVYDRAQLIASIGQTVERGWLVTVAQRAPDLFDVAVADTSTRAPMLRTTLYRPDASDVAAP